MRSIAIAITATWMITGLAGAGFTNAKFQSRWSSQCNGRDELAFAMGMSIAGPINLFVSLMTTGFGRYGWSLNSDAGCKQ